MAKTTKTSGKTAKTGSNTNLLLLAGAGIAAYFLTRNGSGGGGKSDAAPNSGRTTFTPGGYDGSGSKPDAGGPTLGPDGMPIWTSGPPQGSTSVPPSVPPSVPTSVPPSVPTTGFFSRLFPQSPTSAAPTGALAPGQTPYPDRWGTPHRTAEHAAARNAYPAYEGVVHKAMFDTFGLLSESTELLILRDVQTAHQGESDPYPVIYQWLSQDIANRGQSLLDRYGADIKPYV